MMTDTKTVEEYMLEELCLRGLRMGEYERALEFAKKKLDEFDFSSHAHLERKDSQRVLLKDCWNTLSVDYPEENLTNLWWLIERHAFTWFINYARSRF